MDIKLIKQVVDLMKRSDISEFEFEEDGFKLRLSSKGADAPHTVPYTPLTPPTKREDEVTWVARV